MSIGDGQDVPYFFCPNRNCLALFISKKLVQLSYYKKNLFAFSSMLTNIVFTCVVSSRSHTRCTSIIECSRVEMKKNGREERGERDKCSHRTRTRGSRSRHQMKCLLFLFFQECMCADKKNVHLFVKQNKFCIVI